MADLPFKTVSWRNGELRILDQTLLPGEVRYRTLSTVEEVWGAIRHLRVRGAPAIGVAAAYGVLLAIPPSSRDSVERARSKLRRACRHLATARPTARNLFYALERMEHCLNTAKGHGLRELRKQLEKEALSIHEEDRRLCQRIAHFGSILIKSGDRILTHCNAGALATGGIGTALGILYEAKRRGKQFHVYADETRPLLQGTRLTAWELEQSRIPVTLICDSMAGSLMRSGKVDKVVVGADRIARNGDTANKIGTYSLAVLARHHRLPFYVAAPSSTFDFSMRSGTDIPIESRREEEVFSAGNQRMAPKGMKAYNPAFDVTPHELITAFVTEAGVLKPPFKRTLKKLSRGGPCACPLF